jgi:hypothetical protein
VGTSGPTGPTGATGPAASLANPTALVGLTAVNGVAVTGLRSDGAPAIDQTISPTWNATHNWAVPGSGNGITITNVGTGYGLYAAATGGGIAIEATNTNASGYALLTNTTSSGYGIYAQGSATAPGIYAYNNLAGMAIQVAAGTTLLQALGINGNAAVSKVTGWGTPTGPAVVANFSGTAATLVQCSNAIAKIITDLKSLGLYGA